MSAHEQFSSAVLLILVILIALHSLKVCAKDCEVKISLPWEEKIFVPEGSRVLANCTANKLDSENSLEWSIRLPDRQIYDRFTTIPQKKILNNRGFYELPPVGIPIEIIQLIINSTNGINGTVLRCANILSGQLLQETTLIVYEPMLIKISQARDIVLYSVNLSWTSPEILELIEQGIKLNYSLEVITKSNTSPSQTFQLQESFFAFTAPESASPCEIYNFSVTATYIGATYTGPGCSEPSPVLSRMLPSLPDISRLEPTLTYSISSGAEGITLNVLFMPASYCDSYPVTNYKLKVEGKTSNSPVTQTSSRNFISIDNLFDNQIYTFNIIVSNTVGNISTSNRKIYTTDVQKVTVVPLEESNAFVIQCVFLTGSIAQGCMVVLKGEFDTMTVNLTRNSWCAADIFDVSLPVSNYSEVIGYDIESDGSVGTLAIHGVTLKNSSSTAPCMPSGLSPNPTVPFPTWLIGLILGVSLLAAIFVMMFCVIICCICRKIMRSKLGGDSEHYRLQVSRPPIPPLTPSQQLSCLEQDSNIRALTPVYDLPEKFIGGPKMETRSFGHGVDHENITFYGRTSENTIQDTEHVQAEHMYHVLETPHYQSKPQHLNGAGKRATMTTDSECLSLIKPNPSSSAEQVPVYQDIAELCPAVEITNEEKRRFDDQVLSKQDEQPTFPVYQEVSELSVERADSHEQNLMHVYAQVPSAGTNI